MKYLPVCLLTLILIACSTEHTYDVQGRVAGFGDDGHTVIVDHEEIAGYMPGMTMSFKAIESEEVARLEQGDAITFQLNVTRDSSWINHIQPLADDALPASPSGNQVTEAASGDHTILNEGDEVNHFSLVAESGDEITPEFYREQAYVVTFIYTRCPLPDYCPLMTERFHTLQPEIKERFPGQVQLLSISVDPEHDTPSVLREYADDQGVDPDTWRFATGDPEEIQRVAEEFGVFYRDASGSDELMHNLSTAVVGPDGRLQKVWRGNDWEADDVLAALEEIL